MSTLPGGLKSTRAQLHHSLVLDTYLTICYDQSSGCRSWGRGGGEPAQLPVFLEGDLFGKPGAYRIHLPLHQSNQYKHTEVLLPGHE